VSDYLQVDVEHRLGELSLRVSCALSAPWTVLFGPSGAGKTSLLRVLAGLTRPDRSRVVLHGRTLVDASRELITTSEAKRNCMRATWWRKRGAQLRADEQKPDRGVADQGEPARNREALVIKGKRRRSGGRAVNECILTWDLASCPKERRCRAGARSQPSRP
jgi:energy-coupling factor transporter ATP-binding protein EcfA2